MPLPPEELAQTACDAIMRLPAGRKLIALAGPPGAGKSTVSSLVEKALRAKGCSVAVVPMDGFHLDNRLLEERGLLSRKGAPETFDIAGFVHLVSRISAADQTVTYPVFDRQRDLAIAGAAELAADIEYVIFEGNYLLLDSPAWAELGQYWDYSLAVSAPREELQNRLLQRWRDENLPEDVCQSKVMQNDMPNVDLVMNHSRPADLMLAD